MLRSLSAAALAACLAVPARAEPHAGACPTLAYSRSDAAAVSAKAGLGYVDLDGYPARFFLEQINALGEPTAFKADHVGLFLDPGHGVAFIKLADGRCGGFDTVIAMNIMVVVRAYQKARGLTV